MQNMGSLGLLSLVAVVFVIYILVFVIYSKAKKEERANLKRIADALEKKKDKGWNKSGHPQLSDDVSTIFIYYIRGNDLII